MRLGSGIEVLFFLTLVCLPASGDSQTSQVQRPVVRGGVEAVALNVTATDGARRYVTDLGHDDFLILEDGRRQELTFFQKTGLPLALVLLLDTSASMQQSLGVAQEAAIGFARQLGPSDLASVIEFDNTVNVLQGFTSDRGAIERAIRKTAANGSTALYNAVYVALKQAGKTHRDERIAEPRRQAIVVLSDGDDTASLDRFRRSAGPGGTGRYNHLRDWVGRSHLAAHVVQCPERGVRSETTRGANRGAHVLSPGSEGPSNRLHRDHGRAVQPVFDCL